jgi:hypothetical protein
MLLCPAELSETYTRGSAWQLCLLMERFSSILILRSPQRYSDATEEVMLSLSSQVKFLYANQASEMLASLLKCTLLARAGHTQNDARLRISRESPHSAKYTFEDERADARSSFGLSLRGVRIQWSEQRHHGSSLCSIGTDDA